MGKDRKSGREFLWGRQRAAGSFPASRQTQNCSVAASTSCGRLSVTASCFHLHSRADSSWQTAASPPQLLHSTLCCWLMPHCVSSRAQGGNIAIPAMCGRVKSVRWSPRRARRSDGDGGRTLRLQTVGRTRTVQWWPCHGHTVHVTLRGWGVPALNTALSFREWSENACTFSSHAQTSSFELSATCLRTREQWTSKSSNLLRWKEDLTFSPALAGVVC